MPTGQSTGSVSSTTVSAPSPQCRRRLNFARQKAGYRPIQIGFTSHYTKDAALPESLLQATANAPGNQHIDLIQRMRLPVLGFVKRLLDAQFKQITANNAPLLNVVDPELAALARMFSNCLAILATHGNLEGIAECRHFRCLALRCETAATTATVRMRMAM